MKDIRVKIGGQENRDIHVEDSYLRKNPQNCDK